MSHRRRILILLAFIAGLSATAFGAAVRLHEVAAKPSDRTAILKAWNGGARLSRTHAACLLVWLAASDHNYGTVRLRLTRSCEQRWGFNGVNVLKRGHDRHWTVAFEGSAYRCPVAHIPRQVQRDLGVCR
jgi:hypothetical protein